MKFVYNLKHCSIIYIEGRNSPEISVADTMAALIFANIIALLIHSSV